MKLTKIALLAIAFSCLFSCDVAEQYATKEEAKAFAKKLENQANIRSAHFFNSSISIKALSRRVKAFGDFGSDGSIEEGLKQGLKKNEIGKKIFASMGKEGSFELVRIYERDNKNRAIFRMFSPDGGFNYYDLELIKENNEIKIADFFIYLTGENFSETMADLVSTLVSSTRINKDESTMANLSQIKYQINAGNYKAAWDDFNQLPYAVQNTKGAQMIKLEICKNISDSLYTAAISQYENLLKDKKFDNLILLDYYIAKQNYNNAIAIIDSLDVRIQYDPFLNYYRGLMHYNNENLDKAIECHEKLVKGLPNFKPGYEELIVLYTKKDKAKANFYLEKYSKLKSAKPNDIDNFKSFVENN
jgi:tetratricopeptide (TPR) repeat protein